LYIPGPRNVFFSAPRPTGPSSAPGIVDDASLRSCGQRQGTTEDTVVHLLPPAGVNFHLRVWLHSRRLGAKEMEPKTETDKGKRCHQQVSIAKASRELWNILLKPKGKWRGGWKIVWRERRAL